MANGNWPTDPNAFVFAGCNCGAFAVTASAIGMPTTHAPTCPQCTPTDRYWHDQLAAERALRVAAEQRAEAAERRVAELERQLADATAARDHLAEEVQILRAHVDRSEQ